MLSLTFLKANKMSLLAIMISSFLYYFFAFELERSNFNMLIISFTALFLFFLYLNRQSLNWKLMIGISMLFRIILLFATPNLSQDFYRFIWDGRLLLNGFNPYLFLPENYLNNSYLIPEQSEILLKGMGNLNASHYSNYPPLNQLCFLIAALFSKTSILGSIIIFRILMLFADLGIVYFGRKLLINLNLNPKLIFLYTLNPFIIIELFGNLHFEGIMIFFLVWSLYLLQQKKWKLAAVIIACSISLKLLPLLFLPLFLNQLKFKKLIVFYTIVICTVVFSFIPFLSIEAIEHFSSSVRLWFGTFEFNGSFYLLFRNLGYEITGYNTIGIISKVTPILVLLFVLYLSLIKKNKDIISLITVMVFALSFYLLMSSTVHPWYIAMLLLLSIFTRYKFALLWSFTIMLSYSFYQNNSFTNNYWLICIEYGLVIGMLIWEVTSSSRKIKA